MSDEEDFDEDFDSAEGDFSPSEDEWKPGNDALDSSGSDFETPETADTADTESSFIEKIKG